MDLRQLQLLLAIVDHGTVGRAARHLQLSQSALSQSVARLEEQLGVTLFERTRRGMIPTPYGVALASRARNIAREARFALEDIDALRGMGRGHLTIGSGPALASTLVPEAIRRLLITRPKLRVSLREGGMDLIGPALERGEIDLAVLTGVGLEGNRQLAGKQLMLDLASIVCRAGHPLLREAQPALSRCLDYPWVLPNRTDVLRQRLESLFADARLAEPQVVVETSSPGAMKSLTARSDYLTFLPQRLTLLERQTGLLALFEPPASTWERAVYVVYSQRRVLSPTARSLIAQLRQVISEPDVGKPA